MKTLWWESNNLFYMDKLRIMSYYLLIDCLVYLKVGKMQVWNNAISIRKWVVHINTYMIRLFFEQQIWKFYVWLFLFKQVSFIVLWLNSVGLDIPLQRLTGLRPGKRDTIEAYLLWPLWRSQFLFPMPDKERKDHLVVCIHGMDTAHHYYWSGF